MVLPAQVAVWGVGRQDGYVVLLVDAGTGLQQLGVGMKLTVGQQEDSLPWSHRIVACRQTLIRQVVVKIFLHLTLKVFLVPFLFAAVNEKRYTVLKLHQ